MDQERIIERLETFRELDCSTVSGFAKIAGIDASHYAKMLAGKLTITKQTLKKISDAFGISLAWLENGDGEMLAAPAKKATLKKGIPFYDDLPVSAGQLDVITHDAQPSGYLDIPCIRAKALFPVVGCSMKPHINPGDVIGIEPIDRGDLLDPDKIYLVITHDDRMIKHLVADETDDTILWCLSSNYPKFKIDRDNIKYIYRVTFCGKLM